MADIPQQEIKLFYCYAREDKPLRDSLEKHLSWLKRHFHLTNWHDQEILAGEEWEQAIDTQLETAHLILLLISPDFIASDYCYSKEMQRALERHRAGTCRVVPILLRPTFWKDAPFSHLQLLPTDAKAITRWPDQDEAFENVVAQINRTIEDLIISLDKMKKGLLEEGDKLLASNHYEEALAAYEQITRFLKTAQKYTTKGVILHTLKRYEEALAAYEQAIQLNPDYASAYDNKGYVLYELKRYEEALAAYEKVLTLDPNSVRAYNNKGAMLHALKRDEEAKQAFSKARQLENEEK